MGLTAFVFSGQGAQCAGMGKAFYAQSAGVKTLFDAAEQLRPGTLEQCFAGDADTLRATEHTQPCLYLTDLAAAIALSEAGVVPQALAGFSLGEIPALAFGGAFSYLDGFRIACKRGEAMANAAKQTDAGMVAVLKLSHPQIECICAQFKAVYPVNYNTPDQLVCAGTTAELPAFLEAVRKAGGRGIPLAVGGGFHAPFMDAAVAPFSAFLKEVTVQQPLLPVYANAYAVPYGEDVRAWMETQMHKPVRWMDTIQALRAQGITRFYECGIGQTLCKLIQKNIPDAEVFAIDCPEALASAIKQEANS